MSLIIFSSFSSLIFIAYLIVRSRKSPSILSPKLAITIAAFLYSSSSPACGPALKISCNLFIFGSLKSISTTLSSIINFPELSPSLTYVISLLSLHTSIPLMIFSERNVFSTPWLGSTVCFFCCISLIISMALSNFSLPLLVSKLSPIQVSDCCDGEDFGTLEDSSSESVSGPFRPRALSSIEGFCDLYNFTLDSCLLQFSLLVSIILSNDFLTGGSCSTALTREIVKPCIFLLSFRYSIPAFMTSLIRLSPPMYNFSC